MPTWGRAPGKQSRAESRDERTGEEVSEPPLKGFLLGAFAAWAPDLPPMTQKRLAPRGPSHPTPPGLRPAPRSQPSGPHRPRAPPGPSAPAWGPSPGPASAPPPGRPPRPRPSSGPRPQASAGPPAAGPLPAPPDRSPRPQVQPAPRPACRALLSDRGSAALIVLGFLSLPPLLVLASAARARLARRLRALLPPAAWSPGARRRAGCRDRGRVGRHPDGDEPLCAWL